MTFQVLNLATTWHSISTTSPTQLQAADRLRQLLKRWQYNVLDPEGESWLVPWLQSMILSISPKKNFAS